MAKSRIPKEPNPNRHRDWLLQVSWTLVIVFYLLMSIGLVVAGAITLRFGPSFFSAGTTGPAAGEAGEAEHDPVYIEAHRLLEQARSNVLSSISIALGVLSLVSNASSLALQTYLDHRWDRKAGFDELAKRKVWVFIISGMNGIFCAADVALAVGLGLASHALRLYTTDLSSATPGYLLSACIMAAITAVAAFSTIGVDIKQYQKYKSKLDPEAVRYSEPDVELSNLRA